jgi:hypothetical protein
LGSKVGVVKEVKKKSSIPVPFCGNISQGKCDTIRLNHGLYTQCTNDSSEEKGVHNVCVTCDKQISKNTNGMPTYGYITERVEKGDNFRDPKGKAAVNYGNVMEKLKITRHAAEREAANQGLVIPEEQFEVKTARRGRPKKDTTAVDTSGSEDEPVKEEKKRGRPKKEKEVVSSVGDVLINQLVNAVNETKEEEEEEEANTEVTPIKMTKDGYITLEEAKGADYLINEKDNTLYDVNTWDEVGTWDPVSKKKVDLVESDED